MQLYLRAIADSPPYSSLTLDWLHYCDPIYQKTITSLLKQGILITRIPSECYAINSVVSYFFVTARSLDGWVLSVTDEAPVGRIQVSIMTRQNDHIRTEKASVRFFTCFDGEWICRNYHNQRS